MAHLLRRATFGPRPQEIDDAQRRGSAAVLAGLLAPGGADAGAAATPVPVFTSDPLAALGRNPDRAAKAQARQKLRDQARQATLWWLDRMVAAEHQFPEKLTFFWHGHWATSVRKVRYASLMLGQQRTLRSLGRGDFGSLTAAMLCDPALIVWLDGQRNTKAAPNENLAREAMELFTLGVGHYSETDVREAARALTGWQVDRAAGTASLKRKRLDTGSKTVLGRTGDLDAGDFAQILVAQPANADFVAARLWFRFGSGEPMPADTRDRLVAAYRPGRDVTALMRALFSDPHFEASAGQLVKQPVEWAVGAMRQLGIRPSALAPDVQKRVQSGLAALGQVPFSPPSVGGWPAGAAWLTTSATEQRWRLSTVLSSQAGAAAVDALKVVKAAGRPDVLARLLTVDSFTDRTRAVLATAGADPRRLIALGLASPEYAVC